MFDQIGMFGTGGGSGSPTPISGGAVTSVFGRAGAVVATAGDYGSSKITNQSSWSGTYVTNALNNILTVTNDQQGSINGLIAISGGLVPYTGATSNVNLGTNSLISDSIQLNTTPSITAVQGEMYWDTIEGTVAVLLDATTGVTLSLGTEQYLKCVNKTGIQINDGAVVTISGAQGNRPKIVLANATDVNSSMIIGVATQNIADNAEGFITTHGDVHGYDTSGFTAGDTLYLSTTPGQLVNSAPTSPNNVVVVATATNSTNNGTITVHTSRPLAGNTALGSSNLISPTQLAVKTYADTKIPKSIGTTKGDIIVFPVSGGPDRLAVGTNNQFLIADSTQANGVKWGNGVLSVNGMINAVTLTKSDVSLGNVTNEAQIAKSIGTTKGDIIGFSGSSTPVRVAVGTDGQYLVADSASAAGVKWVAISGGTGGGHTIQDEGISLTQRTKLNFIGSGVTVTDNAGNDSTDVSISISGGSGASTFLQLTDTPSSYSGQTLKAVRVNSGETALEFYTPSASTAVPCPLRATIGGDNTPIIASAVQVGYWKPKQDCTIQNWTLLADVSGAWAEIELWKDTQVNYPPTVADKITSTNPISISGAWYRESSDLTGWTTSISASDVIGIKLNSVSGNPTKLELTVKLS